MSEQKDDDLNNFELHKQLATGIAQVIMFKKKALDDQRADHLVIREAIMAGCKGLSKEIVGHINIFTHIYLTDIHKVLCEDYSDVWVMINAYLSAIGYEPVEPVELKLNV